MGWYPYVKLLHVACVIAWLGGGIAMSVLGSRANRLRKDDELIAIVLQVMVLAKAVFIPSSLVALASGIAMLFMGQSVSQLWVILGLAGFAITFLTGVAIISPRAERVAALMGQGNNNPELAARCRQILRIAQFDYTLLFLVAADMVLKPSSGDPAVLIAMAIILAAAGVYFLGLKGGLIPQPAS